MFSFSNPRHLAGAIAVILILMSSVVGAETRRSKRSSDWVAKYGHGRSRCTQTKHTALRRSTIYQLGFRELPSEVLLIHAACKLSQSLGEGSAQCRLVGRCW